MNNLTVLTHVFNEEMLIVHWMMHHSIFAREAIFIDHHSTDKTVELIHAYAPHLFESYRVITSRLDCFDAHEVDQEVMEIEPTRTSEWVMTLNVTEYLWHFDLPYLLENTTFDALGFRAFMMVDPPGSPNVYNALGQHNHFLWYERTHGYRDDGSAMASRRARYMHRQEHGKYALGRHGVGIENQDFREDLNILFAHFSPWPQSIERKLNVQTRIPLKDRLAGSGIQHIQTYDSLLSLYQVELTKSKDLSKVDQDFDKNYRRYLAWMDVL